MNKFMKSGLLTALVTTILMSTLASVSVTAEPYLAQRYGQKCSACHTNITGGGKRTATGLAYAMSMAEETVSSNFSTNIADAISIGSDFRADWTYTTFDDPEEADNGQLDSAIEDTSAFNISNGTLYLEFAPAENLTFYLDQQVAPEGGRTREALVIYRGFLSDNAYLKVGRFFLPYGLRLQDDQAFIREATGFNFDNSDIGFEYGFDKGPWSTRFAFSNGTQGAGENNTDKQVSFLASYVKTKYRVGFSFTQNNAPNEIEQQGQNIFAGLTLGKWVFLGELDWLTETIADEETDQLISFLSVNYLLTPSLNVKLSYDHIDPNTDVDEDERVRVSLLMEKFLNQFTQFRAGVRAYDGIPQATIQNQTSLFTEFHFYF